MGFTGTKKVIITPRPDNIAYKTNKKILKILNRLTDFLASKGTPYYTKILPKTPCILQFDLHKIYGT